MKIYFSGSRLFSDKFEDVYSVVREIINQEGYTLVDRTEGGVPGDVYKIDSSERKKRYVSFIKALDACDISVFEASYPSTLHIGHEITLAIEKGRPVVVLYSDGDEKEPVLFRGINSDKLIWVKYNSKNLKTVLTNALEEAKKMQDVRFNFFVSPKILEYLDFVAKKRMIPRSVFLRDLIEKEMKKDKEFGEDK